MVGAPSGFRVAEKVAEVAATSTADCCSTFGGATSVVKVVGGLLLAEAEALEQGRDLSVRLAPGDRLQQLQDRVVDRADAGQKVEVLADEA